jgi:hypothetical protein
MEAIKKRANYNKMVLVILLVMTLILLIPSSAVLAAALSGHYLIGLTSVTGSNPSVGMTGINVYPHIEYLAGANHLNPSSASGTFVSFLPILFLAVAILILLNMLFSGNVDLKQLVWAVILIVVAFAALAIINGGLRGLLGI